MNDTLDRLYQLLPMLYRQRDELAGEPLRALLRVVAEQVNVVEEDIARLYENWFIETCQEWAVPYIGDLLGYTLLPEAATLGAGGSGLAGFLPYSGALGSQFWFLRDSAASCSGDRSEPLFMKGTGTLVT